MTTRTVKICRNCKKIWTRECPLRVWYRGRDYEGDVKPDKDYCSWWERKDD